MNTSQKKGSCKSREWKLKNLICATRMVTKKLIMLRSNCSLSFTREAKGKIYKHKCALRFQ